jgi:hypothetical protein
VNIHGLANQLARLEAKVNQLTSSMIEFTALARTSPAGDNDGANVPGNAGGDPDTKDKQRPIRRVAPWGLASRPVPGVLMAIVKAVGGAFNGLNVGIATDKYGPQDLNEGETCLYCNADATRVLLTKDGDVKISSKNGGMIVVQNDGKITIDAASGKDVVINAGINKVSRVGDHVNLGKWHHIPASGTGVTACQLLWQDTDGGGEAAITSARQLDGKIEEGADHFKG